MRRVPAVSLSMCRTAAPSRRSSPAGIGAAAWSGACPRGTWRARRPPSRRPCGRSPRRPVSRATIDYWFAGDDHRVHKVVHHFLLEATGGDLTTENDPDHEAEDVAWVDLEDVSRRLAYPNERRIVAAAREILVGDGRETRS